MNQSQMIVPQKSGFDHEYWDTQRHVFQVLYEMLCNSQLGNTVFKFKPHFSHQLSHRTVFGN